MKTNIYSFVCVVVSVLLCISFSACSSASNKTDVYATNHNNSDYTLIRNNNKFALAFDNFDVYRENSDDCALATVEFPNMKEFKDTVTKGLLTDSQKRIVAGFPKNNDGTIITCDFNNLHVPEVPDDIAVGTVDWRGADYYFGLHSDDGAFGWLVCFPEYLYDSIFQSDYLNSFDNSMITVTKSEVLEDGTQEIFYTTSNGQLKNIRYSFTDNGKTIFVDKQFILQLDNSNYDLSLFGLKVSSTVPECIYLYGISEEGYYTVSLYNLTNDPTDEWLANFGLRQYIDTDDTAGAR